MNWFTSRLTMEDANRALDKVLPDILSRPISTGDVEVTGLIPRYWKWFAEVLNGRIIDRWTNESRGILKI